MPPQWASGILRGQNGQCPHRISRVYAKKPLALNQPSNPDFAHLTHAVTMAVTLEQLHEMALEPYRYLDAIHPSRTTRPAMSELRYFAHGSMQDTILWMWHRCRTGIAVSIRANKLALFVPFCNTAYQNTWSQHARQMIPYGQMPPHCWWANGWTLCGDTVSPQMWGDQGVCALQNMILVACEKGAMSDCDFIINKRDSACVRLDRCDPLNPIDSYQASDCRQPNLVPVLSLYCGDQFADIAMPLPSDWQRLSRGTFNAQHPQEVATPPKHVEWRLKRDAVIFRGSLTGTGAYASTNQRIALLCMHDGASMDFKGTGANQRYRYCPLQKSVVKPHTEGLDVGKHNYIAMHKQQEQYRYTLTIDGHSGADRLAQLACGNQCILKVDSPLHALCPETWASQRMHAWEHYIPVARDLSNAHERLKWARTHEHACQQMRTNCSEWAEKEHSRILTWWARITAGMSQLQASAPQRT